MTIFLCRKLHIEILFQYLFSKEKKVEIIFYYFHKNVMFIYKDSFTKKWTFNYSIFKYI